MSWLDDKMTQASDWMNRTAGGIAPPTEEQIRPWLGCDTLPDFGQRVADWLEGTLTYAPGQPAKRPRLLWQVSPAASALFAVNRSGALVTTYLDADDLRAVVGGYATTSAVIGLRVVCEEAGLQVRARVGPVAFAKQLAMRCTWDVCPGKCECPGNADSRRELDLYEWHGRHRLITEEMARVLQDSWQVLVFDPEPNRDDRLWPALARVAKEVRP